MSPNKAATPHHNLRTSKGSSHPPNMTPLYQTNATLTVSASDEEVRLTASRFPSAASLIAQAGIAAAMFVGSMLACRWSEASGAAWAWICWVPYAIPVLLCITLLIGLLVQHRASRTPFAVADTATLRFPRIDLSLPRAAVFGVTWIRGTVQEFGESRTSRLAAVVYNDDRQNTPTLSVFLEPTGWNSTKPALSRWATLAGVRQLAPIIVAAPAERPLQLTEAAKIELPRILSA